MCCHPITANILRCPSAATSLPNITSPGIILPASRRALQQTLNAIIVVAAAPACGSRYLCCHMSSLLRSTVASAVQSGPSHVEVIPRRSSKVAASCEGIHVRPVTRPTSCLDGVRDPTFPAVGVRQLKAQTRLFHRKKTKKKICGHSIRRIRTGSSTADRFTAESRHLPTLYSRQASRHTRGG
jgi:hypothetical protein